jgi:hypothetical protein
MHSDIAYTIPHTGLSAAVISVISVLVTLITVIAVAVITPLVYFAGTQYRRGHSVIYDTPYNYKLPPLPPHLQRMDSGIYDTLSNSNRDNLQNQQLTHTQTRSESKSPVNKSDGETIAANRCLFNSPFNDKGGEAMNDVALSQFPSTNPDTAMLSFTHSYSPSERANLPLNLATTTRAEILNNAELGIPSSNTTEYQLSTRFSLERNPAYGANIAIAPEIETSANIAYEHNDIVLSQSLTTNPDAVVSARPPPSPMHSDLPLERADEGTDLPPLNPQVGDTTDSEDSIAENTNNKCGVPNPDVDVSEASTNFNPVWD